MTAGGQRRLNKGAAPSLFAWNDYTVHAPRLNVWDCQPRCPSPGIAPSDFDSAMEVQVAPEYDYCVTPMTSVMSDELASENEALKKKVQELQNQLETLQLQSHFGLQRLAGSDEDIRFYRLAIDFWNSIKLTCMCMCVCVSVREGVSVCDRERDCVSQ